ncbi:acyl carrier protein [Nocardia takedensis]|uniref:acyl carrier protein n=1 Tax=Nocardia takedensis TaxID=259390 RepID=UPI00030D9903|nr:phosphopantetheine-binding protein [Nocardia takedensis]
MTADRVRGIITKMAPRPPEALADEDRLVEDLGFDSLRLMELTVVLERGFGLPRHRPEELIGVWRVGEVVALVERGLAKRASA